MKNGIIGKITKLFFTKELLIFLGVGATAAFVNFTGGLLFRMVFQGKYFFTISIWFGYIMGSIVSFLLNKTVTFKAHDEKTLNQMVKFTAVFVCSVFIASAVANVVMIVYQHLGLKIFTLDRMEDVARFISIGATTLFNYPAMKFFSFKKINLGKK